MKPLSKFYLLAATLLMSACMGGTSSPNQGATNEEVFKTRESLLNECVTIGLVGNKELATYLGIDFDATGFSEEYDTLNEFFTAKSAEFGGEGLGALSNESMLYFRSASHYAILLGDYLATNESPHLSDMKNLFKSLTAREISDEEYDALQSLASKFGSASEKKAAQFAAIVSSAEVQCL